MFALWTSCKVSSSISQNLTASPGAGGRRLQLAGGTFHIDKQKLYGWERHLMQKQLAARHISVAFWAVCACVHVDTLVAGYLTRLAAAPGFRVVPE